MLSMCGNVSCTGEGGGVPGGVKDPKRRDGIKSSNGGVRGETTAPIGNSPNCGGPDGGGADELLRHGGLVGVRGTT